MTESEIECRNCGKTNIKVYEDGSGFCVDCSDAFADVNEYAKRPKYDPQTDAENQISGELLPKSPPPVNRAGFYTKIAAVIVVVMIVIGSIGYVLMKTPFSPSIIIDYGDRTFYHVYPGQHFGPPAFRGDILWGNFSIWIDYNSIQTVQITPTIKHIGQQFTDRYPNDAFERVKAIYSFVASNIKSTLANDEFYRYPVTTLLIREGSCAESASLLASLLYAGGLSDVALIITNTTNLPHSYVAVKLPTPTEAVNPVERTIKDYLDDNWIAMDPTSDRYGNQYQFRELISTWDGHYNIQTITKVPIFGCAFEFEYEIIGDDTELGYYMDIQCGLFAFEDDGGRNTMFTYRLYHNFVPYSTHTIEVAPQEILTADNINQYNFKLDIDNDFWENRVQGVDTTYLTLTIHRDSTRADGLAPENHGGNE